MNSTDRTSTIVAETRPARLARFENHPAMPALLKQLSPRAVASLFQEVGVPDAAVLMSMMPTRALLLAFDESIWKSLRPDVMETIDVRDLVDWLAAWNEIDEGFLAAKLEAMSDEYLCTVLSRIIKVESASRYAFYTEDPEAFVKLCEDDRERIGPYIVESIVEEDGDVVVDTVRALWSSDAAKLLRIFGRLSDLPGPEDSTHGSAPTVRDIEFERESFRSARGFVTADASRAFFAFAERLSPSEIVALDGYDPQTRLYLDTIERASESPASAPNPIVSEEIEDDTQSDLTSDVATSQSNFVAEEANTAALRVLLEDAQLLAKQSALPLLQDKRHSKEPTLTLELRRLASDGIVSFHARARELAYLANVLRCVPASGLDPLTDDDAKGAAFAVCNLGLELMTNTASIQLAKEPGLIRLFLLGWHALNSLRSRVVGAFASALTQNSTLAPWLTSEANAGLADLRRAIENKEFEAARDATIFLSIVFDSSVCHAIAPLLTPIPKFSKLLDGAGNASQTRWITSRADLQLIGRLLDSLRLKSADERKRHRRER